MSQIQCPACSAANEASDAFCGSCGAPLMQSQAAAGYGYSSASGYPGAEFQATGMVRVGFGPRLLAWLIDAVVLFFFDLALGASSMGGGWLALVTAIYYVICWASMGQTVGKMLLKQTVVTVDGQPLTWGKAAIRYLGYLASGLILGIGFLMIAFGQDRQGLHDRIAGTIVIKNRHLCQ